MRHEYSEGLLEPCLVEVQPDVAEAVEMDAELLARRLAMADQVHAYKHEQLETGLRADQIGPFESLLDFLDYRSANGERTQQDMLTDMRDGGYAVLPTGFGKTALMAKLAVAAGIGSVPEGMPDGRPLRAMVLVPTKPILHQTIGKDKDDGFQKFAPKLRVTPYFGTAKDLTGDVVAITYHSFEIAVNEGRITKDDFDLILADEAHHLMGPKWSAAMRRLTEGQVPVIGLTASPQYNQERHIKQVLNREICTLQIRDMVEMGVLSAVQLLAVTTGMRIKVKNRRGDYSEEELYELSHDPERNRQIIDWNRLFVEQGRKVLSYAMRGNDCWHARHLAAQTQLEMVYDSLTGGRRPIVARAVGSFMKDVEFDAVMGAWDRGEVDVLYVVDKLREGWNSSLVSAVVDASPTASEVVATQRLGRGMRVSKEWPVTVFVTFLDEVVGHKPQFTPWHVLGESHIDNGAVLGRSGWGESTRGAARAHVLDVKDLPERMARSLGADYMLIDELTLTARAEDYKDPPEGWVPIADTAPYWQGFTYGAICALLQNNGFEWRRAKGRHGPMRHISPEAAEFLRGYKLAPIASEDYLTISAFARRLQRQPVYVRRLMRDLDIEAHSLRSRAGGLASHLHRADIAKIETYIAEMSQIQKGDEAVVALADELAVDKAGIYYFLANHTEPIKPQPKILESGREGFVVNALEAAVIRRHFGETYIVDGRMSVQMLVEASGKSRSAVTKWITYLDMQGKLRHGLRMGRYRPSEEADFQRMRFLEAEDAQAVLAEMAKAQRLPAGMVELIRKEEQRRKIMAASRSSGQRFADTVERAQHMGNKEWQELEDVQEQLYTTDFAVRSLLRMVRPEPSEYMKAKTGQRLVRNSAVVRMGMLCVEKVGFAPDGWPSLDRLLYASKASIEDVQRYMHDRVVGRSDAGLFRAQRPLHKVDMYYSPLVALPAYRALNRNR